MSSVRGWLLVCAVGALAAACAEASLTTSQPSQPPGEDPGTVDDGGSSSGASSGGDAEPTGDGGGPPPASHGISIVVEPSDKAQAVLDAVTNAKTSVHVTMYLLDDKRFLSALVKQHQAGRDVKVILNEHFPTGGSGNQAAFDQLKNAGVPVVYAPAAYQLTHEKCILVDGTAAWIMTMNLETSSPSNREFLALDSQAADVAEAESIFAADFAGTSVTPTGNLVVAPTNARAKLVALLESAKASIDLEGEELSDDAVVGALVSAKKRGLKVRVVLADNQRTNAQQQAVADLKAASIPVVQVSSPYVHAKAFVVDGASAYVGSENFTANSLQFNRELGIVTDDATAVGSVASTIAHDFGAGTAL